MHARAVLDHDALRPLAGGPGLGRQCRRHAAFAQPRPRPFQRALETLRAERLEQVVHGVRVESAHRILVVGSDEDYDRRLRASISSSTSKPSSLGIWTSRNSRSGTGFGDGLDGLEPVGAFGHHLNLRMRGQQFAKIPAGQFLVIDEDGL